MVIAESKVNEKNGRMKGTNGGKNARKGQAKNVKSAKVLKCLYCQVDTGFNESNTIVCGCKRVWHIPCLWRKGYQFDTNQFKCPWCVRCLRCNIDWRHDEEWKSCTKCNAAYHDICSTGKQCVTEWCKNDM
jgi:hypothetical protein